jgi:hypothetical protein
MNCNDCLEQMPEDAITCGNPAAIEDAFHPEHPGEDAWYVCDGICLCPVCYSEEVAVKVVRALGGTDRKVQMKMYFSGVASETERDILVEAGCEDFLTDFVDWPNVPIAKESFALDSGAYRAWKCDSELSLADWVKQVKEWHCSTIEEPDFFVMPDIFGDWRETWARWNWIRSGAAEFDEALLNRIAPVWQWGAPRHHLFQMYMNARTVCVGGLVPHMRDKNRTVLNEVKEFAKDFGNSMHILGLNWLTAIEELMPLVASCDTSKWIDGGRYGDIIYRDDTTGHIVQCHHKLHPHCNGMDRRERLVVCARNLNAFVNHPTEFVPPVKKFGRSYALKPQKDFVPKSQLHADKIAANNKWMSHQFEVESDKRHQAAKERMEYERH